MIIKFQPFTQEKQPQLKPIPAIQSLPDWYKKLTPYVGEQKEKYSADGTKNITIKRCNPFGDALGAGYFLVLENSLSVTKPLSGDLPSITWHRGGEKFITTHSKEQVSANLIPKGFSSQPFKFKNDWSIETPKGYSVLITHPLNRNAEPFLTLSGIVETDTYHNSIQLPFLIREDFEGIIEAGTPIAQVIPFKRQSWKANFLEHSKDFFEEKEAELWRVLHRYYKRFHWKRKEWK